MKQAIWIILILMTHNLYSQDEVKKSFEHLSTIKIEGSGEHIIESISFDPSLATVINIRYSELDKSDPFYMEECDGRYIKLLRAKIDINSDTYYIISYNPSCCCSYGFTIYEDGNPNTIVGEIVAERMYLPGNGFIYTDGRMWRNFNKRQKWMVQNDTICEVEQPFHYVGLISKTNSPLNICADKELTEVIASIPVGYEIEVILNDKSHNDLYLVRTSFGLIGWTLLRSDVYQSKDVEGIYHWGN